MQAWGPKEPPKPFWIKKDDENKVQTPVQPVVAPPKTDEMPKPHMGFWTKQQVNMPAKPVEKEREEDKDRDKYNKDENRREYGNKWDRRDDKYDRYRDDRYDRRRDRGRDRDRDR